MTNKRPENKIHWYNDYKITIPAIAIILAAIIGTIFHAQPTSPSANDSMMTNIKAQNTNGPIITNREGNITFSPEYKYIFNNNTTASKPNQLPKLNGLSPDKDSPQTAGTVITWNADAQDPDNDPIFYRFLLGGPSTCNKLVEEQNWSKESIWTWNTTSEDVGNNWIQVQARDGKHARSDDSNNQKSVSFEITEPVTIIIKSPTDGSKVPMIQTIQGHASDIPAGSQIWLVLYAHEPTNRYYPQKVIIPERNGDWSIRNMNIGNRNDAGYKFDIMAIMANEFVQKEFMTYVKASNKAGNWPGIAQLPVGAKEYGAITVIRV